MRALGFVSLLLTLGIIAFMLMKQTSETQHGVSVVQAKVMENQATDAMALASQAQLKMVIAQFHEDKERWPASLDELKTDGLIDVVPGNVDYDPATGEVTPKTSGTGQ
ncbi:MAG TPA: hypothetical protein VK914_08075 [bacterium]|jgi:hypothetical protein|nr:hypothetical protein [bacterium]